MKVKRTAATLAVVALLTVTGATAASATCQHRPAPPQPLITSYGYSPWTLAGLVDLGIATTGQPNPAPVPR